MRQFVVTGVMALLTATTVFGQASVEKKSRRGLWDKVSSQTGSAETRYYVEQNSNSNGSYQNDTVTTQARLNLGVGLFNDKVNTTLTLGATSANDGDASVDQRRPEINTEVAAVTSDYFDLTPSLAIYTPFKTSTGPEGTKGELAVTGAPKLPTMNTVAGGIDLGLRAQVKGIFYSDSRSSSVREKDKDRASQYGIAAVEGSDDQYTDDEPASDIAYDTTYAADAGLDAGRWAKGLSFASSVEFINQHSPVYKYKESSSDSVERERSWEVVYKTDTIVDVNYAVTDALTLTNSFTQHHGGFYQSRKKGDAIFTNLTMMSYTLY